MCSIFPNRQILAHSFTEVLMQSFPWGTTVHLYFKILELTVWLIKISFGSEILTTSHV